VRGIKGGRGREKRRGRWGEGGKEKQERRERKREERREGEGEKGLFVKQAYQKANCPSTLVPNCNSYVIRRHYYSRRLKAVFHNSLARNTPSKTALYTFSILALLME